MAYAFGYVYAVHDSSRAHSRQPINRFLVEAKTLIRASLQVFQPSRRLVVDYVVAGERLPDLLYQRCISPRFLDYEEYLGVELICEGLPASQKKLSCDIFKVIEVFLIFRQGLIGWK